MNRSLVELAPLNHVPIGIGDRSGQLPIKNANREAWSLGRAGLVYARSALIGGSSDARTDTASAGSRGHEGRVRGTQGTLSSANCVPRIPSPPE